LSTNEPFITKVHDMITDRPLSGPNHEHKTKAQLIQDLADIRSQLIASRHVCRTQAEELTRLRATQGRHSKHLSQVRKDAQWLRAFENHPYALAITRMRDGLIERVNPAFLGLFGYSRKEVVGKSSLALGMIDKFCGRELLEELMTHGYVQKKEVDVRTKAGSVLRVVLSSTRIETDDEPRILITIRDITERQKVEKAARLSENLLSSIFRAVPTGIGVTNNRILSMVNERLCEMVGYNQGDHYGAGGCRFQIVG
jgi:PAS domain S-box-containing protein